MTKSKYLRLFAYTTVLNKDDLTTPEYQVERRESVLNINSDLGSLQRRVKKS
ncbi:hypothetical protein [Simiduia litorea]|uniref:hypothetical protein n=1 Tax=Simiduia litorea TaxID=1435348 RepID=UPI0036F31658